MKNNVLIIFLIAFTCVVSSQASNAYARNFSLDTSSNVMRLRIFAGKDTADYALCPQGHCAREVNAKTKIISVPLRRVICMSSVQAGYLEALGLRDRIVGVDQANFICDPALRAAGKRGAWSQVGTDENVDWERVMTLHVDAIFFSFPPGGVSSLAPKANALHIPPLAIADWLENHPLGRAEWLRVYGALFGRQQKADSLFEAVRHNYEALKIASQSRKQRPTAMAGLGWHGQWFVAGGGSYAAQLFRDAGIHYLWENDTHTGSLNLSLETLLEKGRNADLWFTPGEAHSRSGLIALEPRASDFRSFREGHVYQHDAARCATGGDLYWESGATRPDLLLSDLVHIVNGNSADGKLEQPPGFYFRQLPEKDLPEKETP